MRKMVHIHLSNAKALKMMVCAFVATKTETEYSEGNGGTIQQIKLVVRDKIQ